MRSEPGTRRLRHEVADGIAVMGLSFGVSVVLASVIALALGLGLR